MKVGFVNIFAFRPHCEHLFFLASLLDNSEHEAFFLTCDSGVSTCYARALKKSSRLIECSKCMLGGIRSYPVKNITSLSPKNEHELSADILDELALSSSCTLNRIESDSEWNDTEVISIRESLHQPIQTAYQSTLKWIEDNSLDAVVCFNGRMDMTRAVTHACEEYGIPYVTHERTWFGDGLHLVPNANCLSLEATGKMVSDYDNKPLTLKQARFAGKLIADRFLQQNNLESRLYNKTPETIVWPTKTKGKKVLVLPSSRNEFAGHDDWKSGWTDNTKALDDFFEDFSIQPEDVVVRFHPNWAENIGKINGDRALKLYTNWVDKKNIYSILSDEKASTYDLIQQADIVVMNGGSSAVEAGACGKQVICLGPSSYEQAGFLRVFTKKEDMYSSAGHIDISPEDVIRKTLRYVYLRAKRLPQYVDFVKAIETTKYQYFKGASPERLIDMFTTGRIVPDDADYAMNNLQEDSVIKLLENRSWELLANYKLPIQFGREPLLIKRSFGLGWLDDFRSNLPKGDC